MSSHNNIDYGLGRSGKDGEGIHVRDATVATKLISHHAAGLSAHYRGLLPNCQLAVAEGWNSELVDKAIRNDATELVQAAYNVYCMSPSFVPLYRMDPTAY